MVGVARGRLARPGLPASVASTVCSVMAGVVERLTV